MNAELPNVLYVKAPRSLTLMQRLLCQHPLMFVKQIRRSNQFSIGLSYFACEFELFVPPRRRRRPKKKKTNRNKNTKPMSSDRSICICCEGEKTRQNRKSVAVFCYFCCRPTACSAPRERPKKTESRRSTKAACIPSDICRRPVALLAMRLLVYFHFFLHIFFVVPSLSLSPSFVMCLVCALSTSIRRI